MAKTKKEPEQDDPLLKAAEEFCKGRRTGAEFFAEFFAPDGQVAKLYPDADARTQFAQTTTYARLKALMERCYGRKSLEDVKKSKLPVSSQMVTVRMSSDMHQSLLAAARAAGVSLNSFCLQRLAGAILDASLK